MKGKKKYFIATMNPRGFRETRSYYAFESEEDMGKWMEIENKREVPSSCSPRRARGDENNAPAMKMRRVKAGDYQGMEGVPPDEEFFVEAGMINEKKCVGE